MTKEDLYQEINSLPPSYQREIEDFIGYLKMKISRLSQSEPKQKRKIGIGEGKGWIAPDFDVPLEDMKEYM